MKSYFCYKADASPKPKERVCHCVRPIHVCLMLGFLLILTSAITTLVLFKASQKLEYSNIGYSFNHKQQELSIYPAHANQSVYILNPDEPIFKVGMFTVHAARAVSHFLALCLHSSFHQAVYPCSVTPMVEQ